MLGRFDPTILRNGMYRLDLVVTDTGNNTSSDSVTVEVEGSLKLGNFTLSFVDLEVPVAGLPITITRSYDTLDADVDGDFGYGWRMDVANTKVNIDYGNAPELGLDQYRPFVNGSRVVVTLPDGAKEGFTFYAKPNQAFFGLVFDYLPTFIPDYGVKSALTVAPAVLTDTRFGDGTYLGDGQTTYSPLNPMFGASFTLTLRNGNELLIDAESGQLSQIVDRTGNTLTFTGMGIEHSAGRSIQFERDFRGRITALIDPSGKRIEYAYNASGDLVRVTDRVEATTQFTYRADAPHYLDTIIDPLGRSAVKNEYDDAGRLIAITDAKGNRIVTSYDVNGKTQSVSDPLGNTTTQTLDGRGNIVREVDPTGVTTRRTFDAEDHLLSETLVVGLDDATSGETNDLTTTNVYNANGDRIESVDARGNVTRATYGSHGEPLTTTDALGNTTSNYFDDRGLLRSVTDALGNSTSLGYDDKGNLSSARNADGVTLVTSAYNTFGEVTSATPVAGRTTYMDYTVNGDPAATWYFDGTGTSQVQILNRTLYDDNRRVVGSERFVLPNGQFVTEDVATASIPSQYRQFATSTVFNAGGQVLSQTDQNGLVTENTYDIRGQLIQTRAQARSASEGTVWLVTRTVYDAAGRAIANTDSYVEGTTQPILGSRTTYDAAGRVTKSERLNGIVIDIVGQASSLSSVLTTAGTVVSKSGTDYDTSGRVVRTVDNYDLESRSVYNSKGETVETRRQVRNELGQIVELVSRTVYDSLGRVSLQTDRYLEGSSDPVYGTETIYDGIGRAVQTIRREGVQVALNGVETTITSRGTELYSSRTIYDSDGRIRQSIGADGQTSTNEYDNLGRQTATIGHPLPAQEVGLTGYASGTLVALRSETVYNSLGQVYQQRTNIRRVLSASVQEFFRGAGYCWLSKR